VTNIDQRSGSRQLLDIREAAQHLGRTQSYLRRLVARRELTFYRVGRAVRFATSDLDDFLDASKVEARK
jgi:excisionase family DNA binding protein